MEVIFALLLGFVPGLLWLAFFLKEDVHQEPRRMIAQTFIMGGLGAFAALVLEYFSSVPLKQLIITIPGFIEDNLSTFIGFAIIEEAVKFFFVWRVIRKNLYFDEPIDAMIYMVTGALGFATAENFFIVLSNGVGDIFSVVVLRFVGATLLHALSSASVGYLWAWGMKRKIQGIYIAWGILVGSVVHLIFNFLVFKFNDLLVYPTIFLAIIGFFVLYDFEKLRRIEEDDVNIPMAKG